MGAFDPKRGQTVYAADGRKGEFVAKVENGPFIVRPIFEGADYSGEDIREYADGLAEFPEAFAKPPRAKLDEQIAGLNEKADQLRKEIRDLENRKREEERATLERAKLYAKHEALVMIDHFLANEITHFVTTKQYGQDVVIQTFDDFMQDKNDYGRVRGMKLLSLFGDSKGALTWQRSSYSDSSGSGWTYCRPCLSYEQAMEIAAEELEAKWASHRASTDRRVWTFEPSIASADNLGIPVPDDIRTEVREWRLNAYRTQVENQRQALAAAEAALAAA